MRNIVCLSGGKASAYCAKITIEKYGKENVLLYFNDTKWEHEDLYRFLNDLSNHFGLEITNDSDGRNPEELFFDIGYLANNRAPLCSRHLKAERLQKFVQDNDRLIFGIDKTESHRAVRIAKIYSELAEKKKINLQMEFPLISHNIKKNEIDKWLSYIGIELPELYKLGFAHNNCSGGCVRSGKKQWIHLLKTLPSVYRERVESEFQDFKNGKYTYLKDMSLKELREKHERNENLMLFDDDTVTECIGICGTNN